MKTSKFLNAIQNLGVTEEHYICSELRYYIEVHGDVEFPFPPLVLLADSELPKLAWDVLRFETVRKYHYKTPKEFMDTYNYLAS